MSRKNIAGEKCIEIATLNLKWDGKQIESVIPPKGNTRILKTKKDKGKVAAKLPSRGKEKDDEVAFAQMDIPVVEAAIQCDVKDKTNNTLIGQIDLIIKLKEDCIPKKQQSKSHKRFAFRVLTNIAFDAIGIVTSGLTGKNSRETDSESSDNSDTEVEPRGQECDQREPKTVKHGDCDQHQDGTDHQQEEGDGTNEESREVESSENIDENVAADGIGIGSTEECVNQEEENNEVGEVVLPESGEVDSTDKVDENVVEEGIGGDCAEERQNEPDENGGEEGDEHNNKEDE